jgi:phospholipase C
VTYPITDNALAVPVSGQTTVTFRPAAIGLVTAVVVASGRLPDPPGGGDAAGGLDGPTASTHPLGFTVGVRVDIVKSTSPQPAGTNTGSLHYAPPTSTPNRLIVDAQAMADPGDLNADWHVRVTNTGTSPANHRVTVRYQTLPGNLGKIDHIVVMMMENRSFDHMLGYLSLAGRTDVDGIAADMFNNDKDGNAQQVFTLADDGRPPERATYFADEPEHGWDRVDIQLAVASPTDLQAAGIDPTNAPPNSGFVIDFQNHLEDEAKNLSPTYTHVHDESTIATDTWRATTFRPNNPGPVTLYTNTATKMPPSPDPGVAVLELSFPGAVHAPIRKQIDSPNTSATLSYAATSTDLTTPGDWTCRIKNLKQTPLDFSTEISFVDQLHNTSKQELPKAVMGYYDQRQVSTYHFFAENFAVCDRWFASLPTDTFPNRLYALAGGSEGNRTTPSGSQVQTTPPAYHRTTIFEVLQQHGVDWNIFFDDLPFALVYKRLVQDAAYSARMLDLPQLLQRAETGDLPALSWVDPKFSDVEQALGEREVSSDDHPAGDISAGQHLAWQIYDALAKSPSWTKTLFVIFYDEHGGFFDHVRPPGTPDTPGGPPATDGPPDDNPATFGRYGVRVPALAVSPWIPAATADHTVYDHTSVLATVLARFCPDARGVMGQRATHANDFGNLLVADTPRTAPIAPEPSVAQPISRAMPASPDTFGIVLRKSLLGI